MQRREEVKMRSALRFFLGCLLTVVLFAACATTPKSSETPTKQTLSQSVIQKIKVRSFGGQVTLVEVVSSKAAPYTAFKLVAPPKIVLDIKALPKEGLHPPVVQSDQNIKAIQILPQGEGTSFTRIEVLLARPVDYKILEEGNVVTISLMAKAATSPSAIDQNQGAQKKVIPHEPRIFFEPGPSPLNQVIGVDFTLLERGQSRLIITTDKRTPYNLQRKGPKTLVLELENATIPRLLQRHLDATHFEGVVDKVKANLVEGAKKVALSIELREMVPFHINQTDKEIRIDFAPTRIRPPQKRLVPLTVAEATGASPTLPSPRPKLAPPPALSTNSSPPKPKKKYTGAPMTMDFVDADVTNILRLIGEISNLNIIWGPEVKGKVSMRLKNVPWDQALDLVLQNSDLGMRREGNVIWISSKAKIKKIEEEERKRLEDLEKRRLEQQKRLKEMKELEPVFTEYITINYVEVENIKKVIEETVKSPRGKITIDKPSKTIIMTDTASKLKEAKEVAARLDKPTKQVMIEARIVEASTSFSRNLGIQWSSQVQRRNNTKTSWSGTPPWAPQNVESNYPFGSTLYTPNFSTNHPNFTGNLGLLLTTLTGSGLTGAFVNAQIALAESEGELTILNAPKIVTQDTVTATIQQGTKIVLPSGTDANGNKTYQMVDASLKLEVTPHITPNNMVVLDVSISDDFPDYANARGENVPIVTKSAETTMMVASGDTVIIGGIFKETKGVTETGQPWLKDIPVIGWLFKNKNWTDERRELLIFLTPRVLPSS